MDTIGVLRSLAVATDVGEGPRSPSSISKVGVIEYTVASDLNDLEMKQEMLRIAEGYDALAERAAAFFVPPSYTYLLPVDERDTSDQVMKQTPCVSPDNQALNSPARKGDAGLPHLAGNPLCKAGPRRRGRRASARPLQAGT